MGDPLAAAWSYDPAVHCLEAARAEAEQAEASTEVVAWPAELQQQAERAVSSALVTDAAALLRQALSSSAADVAGGGSVAGGDASDDATAVRGRLVAVAAAAARGAALMLSWFKEESRPASWVLSSTSGSSSSSSSSSSGSSTNAAATGDNVGITTPSSSSDSAWAPVPLPSGAMPCALVDDSSMLRLHRIVRLGNLEGKGSSRAGGDSSGTPGEVLEALEGGCVARSTAAISAATNQLAVARGSWVGVMDVAQHAVEMCGSGRVAGVAAQAAKAASGDKSTYS